ncbi:hypothetical protein MZK47_13680 [Microbacterium aerolatum]|nr:hypothetical protein [Microbacterium aerolatum]
MDDRLEGALLASGIPAAPVGLVDLDLDSEGLVELFGDERLLRVPVAPSGRDRDRERDGLAVGVDELVALPGVAGVGEDVLGLVDVDGVVDVLVLGGDLVLEQRAETGDVPDRLARTFAGDVDVGVAVDRPGQRLAQGRVVEGLGLQVEEQRARAGGRRDEELVVRVGVEVAGLDLRDERLRPVGLAGGECGGERGVVAVGDVVQLGNREVAAQ